MSTPNDRSYGPIYARSGHITTIVYDGKGQSIPEGDPRRRRPPEPKVVVDYDRSRHVIRLTGRDGKAAEFDDRPQRFLVMRRNPETKALEPVIIRGEPLYEYLAREK